MDVHTRESLAIEPGQSLKGQDVVRVLQSLQKDRGGPKRLFCDNGSEFSSQVLDLWAYQNGVKIDFSRPGKPTDNGHIESFNRTFRDEYLNTHWFTTLGEGSTMRVVLTGPWGRGRRTSSQLGSHFRHLGS